MANGCENVFYKVEHTTKGLHVIAYAGRVFWEGVIKSKEDDYCVDQLKDMHAREVVADVDIEQIFK